MLFARHSGSLCVCLHVKKSSLHYQNCCQVLFLIYLRSIWPFKILQILVRATQLSNLHKLAKHVSEFERSLGFLFRIYNCYWSTGATDAVIILCQFWIIHFLIGIIIYIALFMEKKINKWVHICKIIPKVLVFSHIWEENVNSMKDGCFLWFVCYSLNLKLENEKLNWTRWQFPRCYSLGKFTKNVLWSMILERAHKLAEVKN